MELRSEVATSLVEMESISEDYDGSIFVELVLANLKERTNANMTHYAVEMVLLFVLKAPLIPGTKMIDLPNHTQQFCKALSEIDHIWKNPQMGDIFTKYSLPNTMEKMQQFIEGKCLLSLSWHYNINKCECVRHRKRRRCKISCIRHTRSSSLEWALSCLRHCGESSIFAAQIGFMGASHSQRSVAWARN